MQIITMLYNNPMNINQNLSSPNFSSRGSNAVSMLVLHYTGMKSAPEALARLCDKQAEVSAHYVADEDGAVYQLVDENNCAWHAGVSYWRGHKNVNNISVGIEIVNPGHEFGYRAFPDVQMQAVAELCKGIIARHKITPVNVVGHSDVAPQRKTDPGELFNWKWLAGQGVGLWPKINENEHGGVQNYSPYTNNLALYGYEIPEKPELLPKVIEAFQRRFRTHTINGIWDTECDELLAGLLKMI